MIGPIKPVQAVLYEKNDPSKRVEFQFNPSALTVNHSCTIRELGVVPGTKTEANGKSDDKGTKYLNANDTLEKLGLTTLNLTTYYDGCAFVGINIGRLLDWSYANILDGRPVLTALILTWGRFRFGDGGSTSIEVVVTKVDVTYERFSADGEPLRAKVNIGLRVTAQYPLRQNPTSGGATLRAGHTVVSGESLASISSREYGKPSQWRLLAAANRIDDPLRVRPGDRLAVPGPAEIAQAKAASG
jgi:LysM repeat protein